jgi:cytochrome c553
MPAIRTLLVGLMAFCPLLVVPLAHAAGDAVAGEALAAPCAACHGQSGVATLPAYPNLAGQGEKYLVAQLRAIKSGARNIALMTGQLDARSDTDLENLAAYYAAMPRPVAQALDEKLDVGAQIYRGGIARKGVAACTACHAPNGNGNSLAGFPGLGGQPAEYLVVQLTAYREGERMTDESLGGVMRTIAGGLTDADIKAVANYVQGLH